MSDSDSSIVYSMSGLGTIVIALIGAFFYGGIVNLFMLPIFLYIMVILAGIPFVGIFAVNLLFDDMATIMLGHGIVGGYVNHFFQGIFYFICYAISWIVALVVILFLCWIAFLLITGALNS